MSGWQPIDSAPKQGYVLTVDAHGVMDVAEWAGGRYWSNAEGYSFEPTHWMPLPAPPEAKL